MLYENSSCNKNGDKVHIKGWSLSLKYPILFCQCDFYTIEKLMEFMGKILYLFLIFELLTFKSLNNKYPITSTFTLLLAKS